jgi:hypothetical protein
VLELIQRDWEEVANHQRSEERNPEDNANEHHALAPLVSELERHVAAESKLGQEQHARTGEDGGADQRSGTGQMEHQNQKNPVHDGAENQNSRLEPVGQATLHLP